MVVLNERWWKTVSEERKQSFSDTSKPLEDRVQAHIAKYGTPGRFDKINSLPGGRVVKVDPSRKSVEIELTIPEGLCNKVDSLHGGAAASLLDDMTIITLETYYVAKGDWYSTALSRTLTMTYLRPVMGGQTVRITCWPLSVGKRAASVYGEIRGPDGQLCTTCIHDTSIVSPGPGLSGKL